MAKMLTKSQIMERQLKQQAVREQNERIQSKIKAKEEARALEESQAMNRAFSEQYRTQRKNDLQYQNFRTGLKNSLLIESIMNIYSQAIPAIMTEATLKRGLDPAQIERGFIADFIEEQGGAGKMLSRWKYKNAMLKEYASIIDNTYKAVLEAVDKNDPDTYGFPSTAKDDFFSSLSQATPDEVIETVKDRVFMSINSFLDENRAMKDNITEIVNKSKEKAAEVTSSLDNDAMKEGFDKTPEELQAIKESRIEKINERANQKINELKRSKNNSVLGEMVKTLGKSIMKDEVLREQFYTDNTFNVDAVVETGVMMYGLLETVNTMGIKEVDQEYINSVLEAMRPKNTKSVVEQLRESRQNLETKDPTKVVNG